MNRSILIVSLLVGACQGVKGPPVGASTARALIVAGADLAGSPESADQEWAMAELGRIAARVRVERQRDPIASPAAVINRTVFDVLRFAREVDDQDVEFVLLPSVLRHRRGSCVGLGTLYLALGALLDVPTSGVMVPGHFFVRIDEKGRARNVELLRRGEEMPDDWYRARYPIAGGGAGAYDRALTVAEVQGVIAYNVGQHWRRINRLGDARRAYLQATRHFPAFAEAQASLGTTLHLLGALDEAAAAYAAAQRAYPDLAGLDRNITLLESERHPAAPTH